MKRSVLIGKLHGLRVTGAELHYEGSIMLDPEHCEAAGILPFEFVEIWNKSSGARISTYVIHGEPGSRCCVLNGAAARTCQAGDELIVAARAGVDERELAELRPRVLVFDERNVVKERITYRFEERSGTWGTSRVEE
jgi:aspartate 1-decarboxylase